MKLNTQYWWFKVFMFYLTAISIVLWILSIDQIVNYPIVLLLWLFINIALVIFSYNHITYKELVKISLYDIFGELIKDKEEKENEDK